MVKPGDGTFLLGFPTQPPWRLSPGAFIVPDNRNRRCLSRRLELGAITWAPDSFQHCTMIIEVDAANLLACVQRQTIHRVMLAVGESGKFAIDLADLLVERLELFFGLGSGLLPGSGFLGQMSGVVLA